MKAQFALAESMIAVLLLVAVSCGISSMVYADSTHVNSADTNTFFFDFLQAAYRNSTFGSCLTYAGESCTRILPELSRLYGLDYIKIENGANETTYGSASACSKNATMCAPTQQEPYSISCIYVCGG